MKYKKSRLGLLFKNINLRSLRIRLVIPFSFLIALISLFIYIILPAKIEKYEISAYLDKAKSIAVMSAFSISPALFFDDTDNIQQVIKNIFQNKDVKSILITDKQYKNLYSFNSEFFYTIIPDSSFEQLTGLHFIPDEKMCIAKEPIYSNYQEIGYIFIGFTLEKISAEIASMKQTTAIISFFVLIFGIIFVFGISTIITQPINSLVETFEQIADGNLDKRVEIVSISEMEQLAVTFNKMVDHLQLTQNELENINKTLEQRVTLRTKELEKEIKERKRVEKDISTSLQEKMVMLKEIHHRVKNNLQIIQSLLYLQSKNIKDEQIKAIFDDSQFRIRSMALVHEKLYQTKDLAKINFKDYIISLVSNLKQTFHIICAKINFSFDIDSIYLSIDHAIPFGLIINELLSNTFKHAFPENFTGNPAVNITCKLLENNKINIMISDNGIGIAESMDLKNSDTLGLKLVSVLVEDQLAGTLQIENHYGTRFNLMVDINK